MLILDEHLKWEENKIYVEIAVFKIWHSSEGNIPEFFQWYMKGRQGMKESINPHGENNIMWTTLW